jgi:hypothetical protein
MANGIDQLHPHIDNAIVGVGEQNHVEAVVGEVLDDAIVAIDATVVADALVAVSDSNLQPQAVVISGQEGRPLGIDARRKPAGASSTSLPSDVREGVLI